MFILKDLIVPNCTKIVQNGVIFVSVANKRLRAGDPLPENKSASETLATQEEDVVISKRYYMLRVMVCQAKNAGEERVCPGLGL